MPDTTQNTWHFRDHWNKRPKVVPRHAIVKDHWWSANDKRLVATTIWSWIDLEGDTFETTVTKTVKKWEWYKNSSKCPPTCSVCGPQDACAFSKTQLRKGDSARCRDCVAKSLC